MKRFLSCVLALSLLAGSLVFTAKAEITGSFIETAVPLFSNETNRNSLTLYSYDGKLYMDALDLGILTRTKVVISNSTAFLSQGQRKIEIDIENQEIKEFRRTSTLLAKQHNGKILLHAYPVLTYMLADCKWTADTLQVIMPDKLFFEAFTWEDVTNSYVEIEATPEIWVSIFCDTLVDVLRPGGLNLFSSGEDVLEEVTHEALNVNAYDYVFVQEQIANELKELNVFLDSPALQNLSAEEVYTLLQSIQFDISFRNSQLQKAANSNLIKFANDTLDFILNLPTEAIPIKADLALADTIVTSYRMITTDISLVEALSETYNEDIINRYITNNKTRQQLKGVQDLAKTLNSSDWQKVYDTAIEKFLDFLIDLGVDKLLNLTPLGKAKSLIDISMAILSALPYFGSLINAYSADLHYLIGHDFQNATYKIVIGQGAEFITEGFRNEGNLKKLQSSLIMYYRLMICTIENRITAAKEFSHAGQEWIDNASNLLEETAKTLYNLSIADTRPIPDIESLAENDLDKQVPELPSASQNGNNSFIVPVTPQTTVPEGYIGIYTPQDLDNVRNNLSGKYILMNDIDLASWGEWKPIGFIHNKESQIFGGVLDGNGYAIINLKINVDIVESAVENIKIGLISDLGGTIKNIGINDGTIEVKSVQNHTYVHVGGIAGNSFGLLYNCYNKAKITCEFSGSELFLGGIAGRIMCSRITHSYNVGYICAKNATQYNTAHIGGIVGRIRGNGPNHEAVLSSCYNNGTIEGLEACPGGIAGTADAYISDCYSTGDIIGGYRAAGIVGYMYPTFTANMSNCYSISDINASNPKGIIGGGTFSVTTLFNQSMSYIIRNCYYLKSYSSELSVAKHEGLIIDNLSPLTPAQMTQQSSYTGFDFTNTWAIDPAINNGYPYLRGLQP